jgi:hypothetical protein
MIKYQHAPLLIALFLLFLKVDLIAQASDNASNYSGSWNNGSNAGTGFGAWSITAGANSGGFIGNPANNGMGTSGIGTTAFGMFATGGAYFNASRSITNGLQIGDKLTFYWAIYWDANSGAKGFDLKSGATTIFNVNNGGSSTISTTNGTAFTNFGTSPMLVTLIRTSSNSYSFTMTARDGGSTYSTSISSSSTVDLINFYIGNQNDGNGNRNMYFNGLRVEKLNYRSKSTGNWSSTSIWETQYSNDGVSWSNASVIPSSSVTTGTITIADGHTITLDQNRSINNLSINSGGTFDNSSNILTITTGGSIANSGTFTKGTGTVNFEGGGTVNGTAISFNNLTINAGTLTLSTIPTIDGTLRINGGNVSAAPIYTSNSTLTYNATTYNRFNEWSHNSAGSIGTTAGYPNNVTINAGTFTLLNGDETTSRAINGTLTIASGATFATGAKTDAVLFVGGNISNSGTISIGQTVTNNTTIPRIVSVTGDITNNGTISLNTSNSRLRCANFTNTGTLTLSTTIGGDLEMTGSLVDNGIFNDNNRAIFFTGTGTQDVSGSGTFDIDYIVSNKSSGSIRLLANLLCEGANTGNALTLTNLSDVIDLNGYRMTIGKSGVNSTITGSGSFKGSNSSSLSILGSGNFGTINFTSTPSLQDLIINRTSGTVTLGSSLTIGGILTLTDGTITLGANTLTMGSSASITRTAGAISGTPTFSGTVDMTYGSGGSAAITTGSELASTINNLTINTSGGVTIGGNTTVSGTLTLNSGKLNTGNNTIYVSNASPNAISGYDNSKYIVGNLKRAVQGNASARSYVFPVGADATNYQETSIDLPAGSGFSADLTASFTASAISTGISGLSVNGTSLTGALNGGFWTIAQSGTVLGTPSYTVTLKMKGYSNGLGTTDANRYAVIKRDNGSSPWQSVGTHSNSTQSESGSVVTAVRSGLTSFSDFTIAFGSNPLPVTFTSLTGTIRNGRTNLNWNIADEHNVDRYEVEESANGRQFQAFTQVDAASRSSYQAIDAQLHTGANYYRVKAVDIDGKLTYSKIIRLDNNLAVDNDIRVYPNPSRGELNLGLNIPAGNYQIRLINAMGQTVYQQPLTHEGGSRSMQLGLPKLSSGVYQVEVRGGVQKHVRTVRIE